MDRLKVKNIRLHTHFPSGALESHELTSAKNQKRYWCEPLSDNVSVLDIEMSELVDSDDVKDMRIEKSSICDREAARTPLSDSRCESSVLNAETLLSKCRGLNPSDERGVARKYSLSDVGCDSDALNVNIDVVGEIPRHPEPGSADAHEVARNPRDDDVTSNDSSSDVSSGLEQITFDDGIDPEIRITHRVLCYKVMMTVSCIHSSTE